MDLSVLTCRELQAGDLEQICTFAENSTEVFNISPAMQYPLTPDQLLRVLEARFRPIVIVAGDGREPLAYANLYDKDDAASSCRLGNVIVSPACRGTGVGTVLVQSMKEIARRDYGLCTMKLFCHNTNTRGLLFYCKHGFQPCGYKIIHNPDQQKIVSIEMISEL